MPVTLNIIESTTELGQEVVEIVLASASEPGPAGPGVPTGGTDGQVLTKTSATDYATAWEDPTGGGGGAPTDATYLVTTANGTLSAEVVVGATPGGELGGTWASPTVDATHSGSSHADVQAAAEATAASALTTHAADTTSVHGIADTSALALTANHPSNATFNDHSARHEDGGADEISLTGLSGTPAALQAHLDDTSDAHDASAISSVAAGNLSSTDVQAALNELDSEKAATSHAHAGEDITSGTVADARIASTIARDSEVTAAVSAHEADTTSVHGIADTSALALTADVVTKALYDANTVLSSDSDNTPAALTMGASTILARLAAGNIKAASVAEILTLLDVPTNAQAILDTLIDAKGDLVTATAADTPARLAVGANGHVLTADSGEATGIKWAAAAGGVPDLQYETRSSNTILGVADKGKTIVATASFTQTLEADETLGDGWWVDYKNGATGTTTVTLDPASAETIDGLATLVLFPGETRRIFCNGSGNNFTSVVLDPGKGLYAQITSDVTISATTEASPTDVVSLGAITFDGSEICIEFVGTVAVSSTAGSNVICSLWDTDSTQLNRIGHVGAAGDFVPVASPVYLTPSAGSHTYKIRAHRVTSNGAIVAGSGTGGSGTYPPVYIRATKA